MHILAAESALRALRAIRNRDIGVPLPTPDILREQVLLPGEEWSPAFERCEEVLAFDADPTLEESGFPFDETESNARVDLSRLGEVGPFTKERPLELVVFSESRKFHRKKCIARVMTRSLPARSIVRIDADVYMVCPELVVLQMSSRLNVVALARLIMELCGTYSHGPTEGIARADAKYASANAWYHGAWDVDAWDGGVPSAKGCAFDLTPVTTIARICWYSRHARSHGATAKLRCALQLAMEGSASPPETMVALMLSLPREMGGYGFARPSLNAQLDVKVAERDNVGKDVYFLDVFWQDAFADVEYESTDFHLDPLAASALVAVRDGGAEEGDAIAEWRREYIAKADADRRRMRDLQYLGIQVVPVTAFDLADVRRLDQVAQSLARCYERATGVSMCAWADSLSEWDYLEARRSLLRDLREFA